MLRSDKVREEVIRGVGDYCLVGLELLLSHLLDDEEDVGGIGGLLATQVGENLEVEKVGEAHNSALAGPALWVFDGKSRRRVWVQLVIS